MSLQDIEHIYSLVKDLSQMDRAGLMEVLGDEVAHVCEECSTGTAIVCGPCYDQAFNDGVDEAAEAAQRAAVTKPVRAVK